MQTLGFITSKSTYMFFFHETNYAILILLFVDKLTI